MKITCKETRIEYDVQFTKYNGTEYLTCPACSHDRKKQKQKCFNWNHEKRVGNCHNCGNAFYISLEKKKIEKKYEKPTWNNNTQLTDKAVQYFEKRGISQFVLRKAQITSGFDWMPQANEGKGGEIETIHFNYYRDEELVNIKYRGANKAFKLHKDAELILYMSNEIKGLKTAVIVEGEIDCLSYIESGVSNCVSVPNGAKNYEFIENCYDIFENVDKWYIAVDNDDAGVSLRNELIRRIGSEKCLIVDFNDCKDANEYMLKYGKVALSETITNAKEIPVDGITTVESVFDSMIYGFRNGKNHGTTTFISNLDKHWTWRKGEVNLFTGYNNEGKSTFWHYLCVLKAQYENYRFALYCPENYPINDIIDELIHCYIGKSTDKRFSNVMSEDEYITGATFINEHFFFVMPEEDQKIESILARFKYLIRKYGVKCCSIDPYNQIEHQMDRGEREDLYISRFMTRLKKFTVDNDIVFTLIAHQTTPDVHGRTDFPKPSKYRIKGGGTFSDKVDNVIAVWRPKYMSDYSNTLVMILIQKIKKQKLVGIPGEIELRYNPLTNRYEDENEQFVKQKNDDINPNLQFESQNEDLPF